MANVLPHDQQIAVIGALSEGMSIRSVERLTGIHRDTIMRLGARIGRGCTWLHDKTMMNLSVTMIELDELWSFVGKKRRQVRPSDGPEIGDQYVFIALGSLNKAILAYRVGKRNRENTEQFVADLRSRVNGNPHINSDAWLAYENAVTSEFQGSDYGQIVKSFDGEPPKDAARRYSPGWVVAVSKRKVAGSPREELISTSYVERSNLSRTSRNQEGNASPSAVRANLDDPPIHIRPVCSRISGCEGKNRVGSSHYGTPTIAPRLRDRKGFLRSK